MHWRSRPFLYYPQITQISQIMWGKILRLTMRIVKLRAIASNQSKFASTSFR